MDEGEDIEDMPDVPFDTEQEIQGEESGMPTTNEFSPNSSNNEGTSIPAVPRQETVPPVETAKDLEDAELAALIAEMEQRGEVALHADYFKSGAMLKYITPNEDGSDADPWEIWRKQGGIIQSEASTKTADTNLNCRIEFSDWMLKNKVSHSGWYSLVELIRKWSKKRLDSLPKTRKQMEATIDKEVEKPGTGSFNKHEISSQDMESVVGSKTVTFWCRPIIQAAAKLTFHANVNELQFEADVGPPFGEYTTGIQFHELCEDANRAFPSPDTLTGL